jgi:hypothetical protein
MMQERVSVSLVVLIDVLLCVLGSKTGIGAKIQAGK